MALKPRTFRRIVLIGSLASVIVLLLVGVLFVRPMQRGRSIESMRIEGLAASQAGDHVQAATLLGRYIRSGNPDPEYHLTFARSRLKWIASDGGHVIVAMNSYREYLKAFPDDVEAGKELLPLFNVAGMFLEAKSLAVGLHEKIGDSDIEVLRQERFTREQLGEDAEIIGDLFLRIDAHEDVAFKDYFLYADWLRKQGRADHASELIASKIESDANNVGAKIVELWIELSNTTSEQTPEGIQAYVDLLSTVLGLDPETHTWATDPTYLTVELVSLVDHLYNTMGRPDLSIEVRLASARILKDEQSMMWSARRLYWKRDFERLFGLGAVNTDGNMLADVLGYQALAYRNNDDSASEVSALEKLDSIDLDFRSDSWRSLLDGMKLLQDDRAVEARPMLKDAIETYPTEPYFHMIMGDLRAQQGQIGEARQEWIRANELSIGAVGNVRWVDPLIRVIEAYTKANRLSEAIEFVDGLIKLAPQNPVTTIIWLRSYAALARVDDLEYSKTLNILSSIEPKIDSISPDQLAIIAPQIATLYASVDQFDQAREVLSKAIQASQDQQILTEILEIDQRYELGIAQSAGIETNQVAGASPSGALRYAINIFAKTNDIELGLELIDQGVANSSSEEAYSWGLVRAQYLDLHEDSRAKPAWAQLRDQNPDRIDLLYRIAESNAYGTDLESVNEVIDVIIKKTATEGKTIPSRLRLAQANAIVRQGVTKSTRNQAIEVVRSVVAAEQRNVQARNMLARLLAIKPKPTLDSASTFSPDIAGAISEYITISRQLNGRSAQKYLLEAVDLSYENNAIESAKQYLLEFDSRFPQDYNALPQVASRLENLNDLENAQAVYLRIYQNSLITEQQIDAGLALVNVYSAQDLRQQVQAMLSDLSGEPQMSKEQLLRLASLHTKMGFKDQGDSLALRGEEFGLSLLDSKMVYAQYAGSFVSGEAYQAVLAEIIELDPASKEAWGMLIRSLISQQRFDEAQEIVGQAMIAIPDDQELHGLSVMAQGPIESAAQLLDSGVVESSEFMVEAVSRVDDYIEQKKLSASVEELVGLLTAMLNDFPEFAPIQRFGLRELVSTGIQPDQIASFALRASRFMPDDRVVMEIGCDAYIRASMPLDAMGLARLWRTNMSGSPMQADVFIAQAFIQLESYTQAKQTLAPYILGAFDSIEIPKNAGLVHSYSHAQILEGVDPSIVSDRLEPLLQDTEAHDGRLARQVWISLAAASLPTHLEAARWLTLVTQYSTGEQKIAVSGAWLALIDRFDVQNPEYAQSAIDLLEADLAENPENLRNIEVLARSYVTLAQRTENPEQVRDHYHHAIRLLDSADTLDPKNLGYLAQGAAYATQMGDYPASEQRYRKLMTRKMTQKRFEAMVHNNLAMLIERQGAEPDQLAEALELSELATQEADIPAFWGTRGWVELALGQFDQSQSSFGRSISRDQGNLEGWVGLAIAHHQAGEAHSQEAREAFVQVMELVGEHELNEDLYNRLRENGHPDWISELES